MRIVGVSKLHEFWAKHPDAKSSLEAWHAEAVNAVWMTPHDIKSHYGNASIVGSKRVVFNICGNKHRLVVHVNYGFDTVSIRFIGTHAEYDKIDVRTI